MGIPWSQQVQQLYHQARDMAGQLEQEVNSAHLLLAFFLFPNKGEDLLRERGVDEERVLAGIDSQEEDQHKTMELIAQKAEQVGFSCQSHSIDTLHVLIGIFRVSGSMAHRILVRCGVPIAKMRTQAMSYLTGRVKKRFDSTLESTVSEYVAAGAHSRSPSMPSLFPTRIETPVIESPSKDLQSSLDEGEIDSELFPWLSKLGKNLTDQARQGKIDPLIGRERELNEMIDILGKRRTNNPCLVGEPGVGKTALVEGLAVRLATDEIPGLSGKIIVELDIGGLLAGTQLRGSLSEKMKGIKEEVRKAEGQIIIFIDEIHTLVRAGSTGESAQDAANDLKAALSRGQFPCIGATTHQDYKMYIENDPSLVRRFQQIWVEEPTPEETLEILRGLEMPYAFHHQVRFTEEALEGAVRLTDRYMHNLRLPAKAIDILDLAGSRARRAGTKIVGIEEVANVIAQLTSVPEEHLLIEDRERLLQMEDILGQRIIGHHHILGDIADVIRRNSAGFNGKRPIGSFLFLGPTGVGKTETAKALAKFLFSNGKSFFRIDMSEYQDTASVTRLIGAPPGYVGHDEGGQLTEAVRNKPYQLILLDEIEKAHRDVLLILLQLLDEGHLTDGKGRRVSFSQCVIVMTSNLGSECVERAGRPSIGFSSSDSSSQVLVDQVLESARKQLPIEFWNRIDERLVFQPLKMEDVRRIAQLLIRQSSKSLIREKNIGFTVSPEVVDWLIDHGGYNQKYGVRPMRSMIQRHLEANLANSILRQDVRPGDRAEAILNEEGRIRFVVQQKPSIHTTPVPPTITSGSPVKQFDTPAPIEKDDNQDDHYELDLMALPPSFIN